MTENTAPLVSVVIPTYNHARFLDSALQSVLDQTYTHWEAIIIDNHSTDNTDEVMASFTDSRFTYIKIHNNGVIAASRNAGIRAAKGEFIAFLDSDDIWLPRKLEIQLKYFESNKELLLVGTNCSTFPCGISNELFIFKNHILSFEKLLKNTKGIITSSVLMKREVVDYVGFFDEDKRLIAVEDFDYWLRLLKYKNNSILVIKQSLVKYRLHSQNISSQLNSKNNLSAYDKLLIIYEKHRNHTVRYIIFITENIENLKATLYLKELYFRKKITIKFLFQNEEISLKSKCTIVAKDIVWKFLRFIHF